MDLFARDARPARAWTMKRGKFWCIQCGYQVSATAGTLFHDTHKPLRLWFEAMWYVTSQKYGVSALGLAEGFGFGQLSYRLEVVAQTSARHGPAWT